MFWHLDTDVSHHYSTYLMRFLCSIEDMITNIVFCYTRYDCSFRRYTLIFEFYQLEPNDHILPQLLRIEDAYRLKA